MNQTAFYEAKLKYEIDAWDLNQMMRNNESVVIIDTRSVEAYEKEHIPSAVNFPHRAMNEASTSEMDKSKIYITYCDGIGCNASTKGALNLSKLGFNVRELLGGLDWWKRDGYSTERDEKIENEMLSCGCN